MKPGRLWHPLDVEFWDDPDTLAVGESGAVLFLRLIAYAKKHQTNGYVPMAYVKRIGGRRWQSKMEPIVCQGWATLTDETAPDGCHVVAALSDICGSKWCHVVAFLAWNDSNEDVEQRREIAREKKRKQRAASADVPQGQTTAVPTRRVEVETETETEPTPKGVGVAQSQPTHAPPYPIRRRDVHDYHGAQATAAQVALSAACQAAGGAPRPRGGFPTQQAWAQVACDAHELAESLGRPVAEVLALSATGFVASRGIQASPTWWGEDFGRYFEAGRKGAPRKAGSMTPLPKPEDYKPTTDEELDAMFGPEVSA